MGVDSVRFDNYVSVLEFEFKRLGVVFSASDAVSSSTRVERVSVELCTRVSSSSDSDTSTDDGTCIVTLASNKFRCEVCKAQCSWL